MSDLHMEIIIGTPALLVLILVCYGLVSVITERDGPFDLLLKLRVRVGVYDYDESGQPKTGLGKVLGCPYCLGVWVALPLSFVITISWLSLIWWWAIVGGTYYLLNKE